MATKQLLSARCKFGITIICLLSIPLLLVSLPWAWFMFIYAPFEGAKSIVLSIGVTEKLADYLAAAQVGANLFALVIGLFWGFRQQPLQMPRGSKGLLIYILIAMPALLYAIEIYATRETNPFLKFDSSWHFLLLFTHMNPIFPPLFLMAALECIAKEFYGKSVSVSSTEEV